MQSLSCQEIRNKWIEYFTQKCERKHSHTPSGSLVPDNPTLLLNAAGMVQFVPIFLGIKDAPNPPRTITIQKCVRVGGKDSDLENIGRTSRHHSFFEMLGNFSFGDYFKAEVIPWAWDFVTKELGLEADRLTVSVFAGDDQNAFDKEAYDLWIETLTKSGVKDPAKIIKKMGRADNFWGPPGTSGPCGPCTEIYYDLGDHIKDEEERFVEIWNLVFMELDKDEDGNFQPLAKKNIDTGAGLERLATILQNKANTFETDELFSILKTIEAEINKLRSEDPISYKGEAAKSDKDKETDIYLKIITDHIRCLAFLIADAVRPSNLGRGYVLRMIIRRAARFAYLLSGSAEPFLYKQTDTVVNAYKTAYPELAENAQLIKDICKKEEEQFSKTIEKGLAILNEGLNDKSKIKEANGVKQLCGEFTFDLYSTYGLPLELTQEIALEKGIEVHQDEYNKASEKHSQASSTGAFKTAVLKNKEIPAIFKEHGETKFLGYQEHSADSKVLALLDHEGKRVESLAAAEEPVQIILNQSPFYGESGGQMGDTGSLNNGSNRVEITDTKKAEGLTIHIGLVKEGSIKVGDQVKAEIDEENRRLSKAHHSTCHLLQAALKKVLGDQVQQAGSQVGAEYTRFDFNFDRGMNKDELKETEKIINGWIAEELPVSAKEMTMDEANQAGALAFFEEKYGDKVRVLFMGNDKSMASVELCGGTHVSNTKEIEIVKVVTEGSVAAGIRRIKLVTNDVARKYMQELEIKEKEEQALKEAQEKAKAEAKARKKEMAKKALAMLDELAAEAEEINGNKTLFKQIDNLDADGLKALVEGAISKLKAQGSAVVMLGSASEGKVSFVAAVSDDLCAKGASNPVLASNLVRDAAKLCGGGGGGRPNFAQAGAKDASKIQEALDNAKGSVLDKDNFRPISASNT